MIMPSERKLLPDVEFTDASYTNSKLRRLQL